MPGTHSVAFIDPLLSLSVSPPPTSSYTFVNDQRITGFHDGFGRIYGVLKIKGTPDYPVKRKVRLIRDMDSICIRETWSDPTTGAYEFTHIDPHAKYTVLAFDYEENYKAVVQDNITPELMTVSV